MARSFDEFEARHEAAGARRQPLRGWRADLRTDLERTWEHILHTVRFSGSDTLQGTMHILQREDVVEAVRLIR